MLNQSETKFFITKLIIYTEKLDIKSTILLFHNNPQLCSPPDVPPVLENIFTHDGVSNVQ